MARLTTLVVMLAIWYLTLDNLLAQLWLGWLAMCGYLALTWDDDIEGRRAG